MGNTMPRTLPDPPITKPCGINRCTFSDCERWYAVHTFPFAEGARRGSASSPRAPDGLAETAKDRSTRAD